MIVAVAAGPYFLRREFPEVTLNLPLYVVIGWGLAGAIPIGAGLLLKKRMGLLSACIAGSCLALLILAAGILPWVNEHKSPRYICGLYNVLKEDDSQLAMVGSVREEYVFYAHTRIRGIRPEELQKFFSMPARMFCLARKRDVQPLLDDPPFPLHVVTERRVSSRLMVLLCNQPWLLDEDKP